MYKKIFLLIAVLLFIPSCAFGITENTVQLNFFDRFNDENLSRYIAEAYTNNHTLKQAAAKTEQFAYQVKYQLGYELPSLSVSANYTGINTPDVSNFKLSENAFALPFIASYEADFLLKNRDKTKAAKKEFEAEKLNEITAYISLLSDVGTVYANILQYDKLIENQSKIVNISNEILDRNERKFAKGIIDNTTLNSEKTKNQEYKNTLLKYENERDILLMQLAVLTANSPDTPILRGSIEKFEYQGIIPDKVKSDVIFNRPDVLAAEKLLEKAKIDVRVARKEFLPSFNITGVWAFNTLAGGTFFSWESSLAMLIAGASQDIFSGGKKAANLKMKKAMYEQIFENYRQTDLEALKEVNTALCIIKHKTAQDNNTKIKLTAQTEIYQNALKKLKRGIVSQNEFLQNEILLLTLKNEAINAKTERIVNYFTLYKALGGQI